MFMLEVLVSEKALDSVEHKNVCLRLAEKVFSKFNGLPEGKFNRFIVQNPKSELGICLLVYFETHTKANVMTYSEAMQLPKLAEKCIERWGNTPKPENT